MLQQVAGNLWWWVTINIIILIAGIFVGVIVSLLVAHWLQKKMQVRELKIKRAVEIFAPLHKDIEEKIGHFSAFAPSPMSAEIFEQRRSDYLFLASEKKIRKKIEDFYQRMSEYNSLLARIRGIVQHIIAHEMYDTYVHWGARAPESLNTFYNGKTVFEHYREEAAPLLDAAISIALKHKSPKTITKTDHWKLGTPVYNYLREHGAYHPLKDSEEIDQAASVEALEFSASVFRKVYSEKLLAEAKKQMSELAENAKELKKYLSSKIQEIILD